MSASLRQHAIYDHQFTRLQLWTHKDGEQKMVEAWSNVDWNHLGGFASFKGRGKEFTFLMVHGNSSLGALRRAKREHPEIEVSEIPEGLAKHSSGGSCCVLGLSTTTHGDPTKLSVT